MDDNQASLAQAVGQLLKDPLAVRSNSVKLSSVERQDFHSFEGGTVDVLRAPKNYIKGA